MDALRKAVIAVSALSCGIAAAGASFEKGPIELPATLPVQLSMPFAAIPADALNALDPLSKAIPAVPPELAVPAAAQTLPKIAAMAAANGSNAARPANESSGGEYQRLNGQFDGSGELPVEEEFVPPSAIGAGGVARPPFPSPAKYYELAFEEAVYQASREGIARSGVTFREVTGTIRPPAGIRPELHYCFDAQRPDGAGILIYVDVAASRRPIERVSIRRASKKLVSLTSHEASLPAAVRNELRASPETALRLAREKAPSLGSPSFSAWMYADGSATYSFYDDAGWHVTVGARTGEVKILRRVFADDEIRAAAAEVAKHKGMPWSHSEYDGYRVDAAESLRSQGATDKQLKLFEKQLEKAPVLGGRFNPWAGD